MELVIAFIVIVALLSALDIAALKWGKSPRRNGWAHGGYDPREEWNPRS